jgi:hypothetical protein
MYAIYDRTFYDISAKNTVYTHRIYMVLANPTHMRSLVFMLLCHKVCAARDRSPYAALLDPYQGCLRDASMYALTFVQAEIASRVLRHWLPEDDEVLDPDAVKLAERVLQVGKKQGWVTRHFCIIRRTVSNAYFTVMNVSNDRMAHPWEEGWVTAHLGHAQRCPCGRQVVGTAAASAQRRSLLLSRLQRGCFRRERHMLYLPPPVFHYEL